MKGGPLIPKLIISLSLGFVVFGVKADSIAGQSLQKITLEAENKPTYPQFLIPNSRLRVLIDPEQGLVTDPEANTGEPEISRPRPRSAHTPEKQNPKIIKYPDGTISLELDKRHLKYLSIYRCADPDHTNCEGTNERTRH